MPPQDVVTIVLSDLRRAGTAYTYRGELKYRGAPLTRKACRQSELELVVRKVKGSKTTGRPARARVSLTYVDGHCLFGTRYLFYKRYTGKTYALEFRASVKTTLPVIGGKSRKPAAVTVRDTVKVGRASALRTRAAGKDAARDA